VEVYYVEEKPENDEGPFLKEERSLLDVIAERLGGIIEQKQAQETLREYEKRLRLLYEKAPIGYQAMDKNGCLIEVSRAWLATLGYSQEDVIGHWFGEFLTPESVSLFERRFPRFKAIGEAHGMEYEMVRKDGSHAIVSFDGTVSYDERGNFRQTHCVMHDITERKRTQELLQHGNRELLLLSQANQMFGSTLDLDRVLTLVLEEVRRLLNVIACSIWLLDPQTDELVCRQATGLKNEVVRGWRLAPGVGICGATVSSGESQFVPDTHADERYFAGVDRQTGLSLRSILSVPLQFKENVTGVLQAVDTEPGHFDAQDLMLLESLAAAAAIAIENARLYQEAQRLWNFNENIVQSVGEGIFLEDAAGYITFVNPKTAELLGYAPEELLGRHWTDFTAPESLARAKEETRKRPQGVASQYEGGIVTRDGRKVPGIVSAQPLFEGDRFTGVLTIFTDITEHKRAEEALRRERDFAQSLVETAQTIVLLLDTEGRIASLNPYMEEISGYRLEEVQGKDWFSTFLPPGDHKCIRELFLQAVRDVQTCGNVNPIITRDGHERQIEWYDKTLKDADGNVIGLLSIGQDVTERKRAEKALQESEERYRIISEIISDFAYAIRVEPDETLTLEWVTDAFQRITGFTTPELVALGQWEKLVYPDDLPIANQHLQAHFAGHSGVSEYRIVTKSGEIRWLRDYGYPVWNKARDRIVRIYAAAQDITERKQAEEALTHRMEQLTALSQASQAVTASLDLDQVLTEVVSLAGQVAASDHAGVLLVDEMGRPDQSAASVSDIPTIKYRVRDDGLTRWIIRSHQPIVGEIDRDGTIIYPSDAGGLGYANPYIVELGARSFAGLPMIVKDRLLGVLYLHSLRPGAFDDQLPVLTTFANQAAIAIENARLYEQIQRHTKELERRVADRTRDLSILYEVTAIASQVLELKTALRRALEHILVVMQSIMGEIHVLGETGVRSEGETLYIVVHQEIPDAITAQMETTPSGHGLVSWVFEHDESLLVPDISTDPRASDLPVPSPMAYIGVPIRVRGQVLGVLGVFKGEAQPPFNMDEITLLTSIADHMGIVVESARLRRRIEQTAVLEERERLARELHDSITQSLYGLTLFARWARSLCDEGDLGAVRERVVRIGETAQQALKEMRLLVYELRPELLEQDGLVKALQRRLDAVEKRAEVQVSLQAEMSSVLPAPVEEGLYRVAQEALNNAIKHASAGEVTVRVEFDGQRATLEIEDNGSGFALDKVDRGAGLGLTSMRERIEKLGGTLSIRSAPGEGTTVRASVGTNSQD
jgi:PAS domain S-box-containing protein